MSVLSEERLTSRIIAFTGEKGSCLFAGAGVGKRAGLPLWGEYLEHLASVAERYEEETALLIRKRAKGGHYLEAGELYKECIEIPLGVRYAQLAAPFACPESYRPKRLRPLMVLPFSAVVTTNYDRSLHDAYFSLVKKKDSGLTLAAPRYVELGDASMRHAIDWRDFYIARVHGRAELPETMVVDRNDYRRTENDADYLDFLGHVLRAYRCLFVGYSFVDPGIGRVLEVLRETVPAARMQLHLAVLPSDCDPRLRAELEAQNIEAVLYDHANQHEVLWRSIRGAQKELRTQPREGPAKVEGIPGLKRFVASSYARLKLGRRVEPLRDIVVEGIVAQAVMDSGARGAKQEDLIVGLKEYVSLSDADLAGLVGRAVDGLLAEGLCGERQGRIVSLMDCEQEYAALVASLVQGAVDRLKTREGVAADERLRRSISEVMEQLLLMRGWDLGAHFAGGHPSSTFEAWRQIEELVGSLATRVSSRESAAVGNAVFDLVRHPEDAEAALLADAGRIAFGVELVLNHARWAVVQPLLLAGTVYLDASVVMPAIVEGHPYSPAYGDAISRMQTAVAGAGSATRVFTATVFLNEIVAHRELAMGQVEDEGLEDVEKLRRHVLMWGADRINVYIGAYSSWIGRLEERISFGEFLARAAPYGSVDSLATYLEGRGIRAVELSFRSDEERDCYNRVRTALRQGYEDMADSEPYYEQKAKVLIDDEAQQLARVLLDMEAGRKPLFVTADKRLMGLCRGPTLGRCADAIVSHVGFVQLIDLVVGVETDKRALGRLMWSIGFSDERTAIRNYLIDLAVQHYDEARVMAMWQVVDRISDEAARAAGVEGVTMFPPRDKDRARTAAFLDRFEQDFYENMAEAVRKREAEIDRR